MPKRRLIGIVVSDKMEKTRVVEVSRFKQHPKYLRRVRIHENYKAHDEKGEYHVGDKVVIEESRPISRDKRWVVIGKL
ncbi:MAG: 30S ribosomal protein S17 [Candidatus Wildermuthbacteria bacterium RIFCSPLOWO2_02_FULL_47_9c]|uniref:Small ribosomal subunit protein uS17 n=2 Tax=Parcubacteria group TaxID=1794811 RepID=A0A837ILQ9_9BACT|nr:MAG: 30S ribosomal protein S17 [Candidatus Yanofskybacteria bacterium GW2011_GWC1_48_11]KKW04566.1 MAG: 30S ribosomal protein S17 [Parcubacteria group bacterium GW2011_GWB1_49_12]KKW09176.1 MAG: 30S ribosomal protein S17 [Parcubacteria group bacterium GW2011_GWA1_49_26]KKW13489.1 MAG: 30S ribosomal protein S17 [Parcubacteria group bacterium GW2011_GWA2_50_10]OHA61429.1 MAG: 30S ribosomal protein S17 [Candidatus Wildermuthbacteria bacterium GWA1_49_26]OHA66228.1 MAG: 30S ribosomal protein S1